MPITKDPFFLRYVSGVDTVEPIFRQLKQDRPELQLIMVVLPGKTPVYGEGQYQLAVQWVVLPVWASDVFTKMNGSVLCVPLTLHCVYVQ